MLFRHAVAAGWRTGAFSPLPFFAGAWRYGCLVRAGLLPFFNVAFLHTTPCGFSLLLAARYGACGSPCGFRAFHGRGLRVVLGGSIWITTPRACRWRSCSTRTLCGVSIPLFCTARMRALALFWLLVPHCGSYWLWFCLPFHALVLVNARMVLRRTTGAGLRAAFAHASMSDKAACALRWAFSACW